MKVNGLVRFALGIGATLLTGSAFADAGSAGAHDAHRHGFIPPHVYSNIMRNATNRSDRSAAAQQLRRIGVLRQMQRQATLRGRGLAGRIAGTNLRQVSSAGGKRVRPGTLMRSGDQGPTGNLHVDTVFDQDGELTTFAREVMGRNGVGGQGSTMNSTVEYGEENAFYFPNENRMVTGMGSGRFFTKNAFITKGVVSHERGHEWISNTSNLVYRNQPGAMNEAFADIVSAVEEQYTRGETAQQAHWMIGPGIWAPNPRNPNAVLKALRTFRNEPAYDDAGRLGKDPQPKHMSNYVNGSADNGGVHTNSGIINHAFFQFATQLAEQNPEYARSWTHAFPVFQAANEKYLNTNSQFQDLANATLRVATDQHGADHQITQTLVRAWSSVGITPNPAAAMRMRETGGKTTAIFHPAA